MPGSRCAWGLLICFLGPACGDSPDNPSPHVFLVTLDTTRADRLSAYGYPVKTSPRLDQLAGRGVRFDAAYSSNPVTLPSHATILTGTYPTHHGIRDNGFFRLDDVNQTWPEYLKDEGYQTAGIIAAGVLRGIYGIDQGFDHFDDRVQKTDPSAAAFYARTAEDVTNRALQWVSKAQPSGEPMFLWVHYFDPHVPWTAPEEWMNRVDRDRPQARYDACIAYMDSQIGRLFDGLDDLGCLSNSIIVAVADHGEALGQHGEDTHGLFVYDEVLRVPCIIAGPGIPQSQVSDKVVRTIDLLPTVLDALGLEASSRLQGVSLLPELTGQSTKARDAYMETYHPENMYGWSWLEAIRSSEGFKYIDAPSPELYDLNSDPNELTNILGSEEEQATKLRDLLTTTRNALPDDAPRSSALEPSASLRDELAALGYAPEAAEANQERGPDVKEAIKLFDHRIRGMTAVGAGDFVTAEKELKLFLAGAPQKGFGYELLGAAAIAEANAERAQGNVAKSEAALRKACDYYIEAVKSPGSQGRMELASILKELGRDDEMLTQLKVILEQDPESVPALQFAGEYYLERREFDRAIEYFDDFCRQVNIENQADSETLGIHLMRAQCQIELEAFQAADVELQRLQKSAPQWLDPVYWMAVSAHRQGNGSQAKAHLKDFLRRGQGHDLYRRAKRLLNRIDR